MANRLGLAALEHSWAVWAQQPPRVIQGKIVKVLDAGNVLIVRTMIGKAPRTVIRLKDAEND